MKKIIFTITAIILSVCLAGCSKGATPTTITSLSNQLDKTSNTVSDVSLVSPTEISLENSNQEDLSQDIKQTQQYLLGEHYYRTQILEKTAHIKEKMAKDVKLSRNQTAALKDLVLSLNKYTNLIAESKGEMSSSAKSIASMKKDVAKNREKISAKVNRLACNSNIRSAYYENILNTLDEISCYFEDAETEESQSQQTLTKNIDSYEMENEKEEQNETKQYKPILPRNIDTYGPSIRNIDNYYGGYGRMYGGMYGYGNMPYGYPYGRPVGPNGMYGSNYYNRATTPNFGVMPVNVETEGKENNSINEKECENCEQTVSVHNVIKKMPKEKDDRVVIAH